MVEQTLSTTPAKGSGKVLLSEKNSNKNVSGNILAVKIEAVKLARPKALQQDPRRAEKKSLVNFPRSLKRDDVEFFAERKATCNGRTSTGKDGLGASGQTSKLSQDIKCGYRTGKCINERALKQNGERHSLCEAHRQKANESQRRLDRKKQAIKNKAKLMNSRYNPYFYGAAHYPSNSIYNNATLTPRRFTPSIRGKSDPQMLATLQNKRLQGDSKPIRPKLYPAATYPNASFFLLQNSRALSTPNRPTVPVAEMNPCMKSGGKITNFTKYKIKRSIASRLGNSALLQSRLPTAELTVQRNADVVPAALGVSSQDWGFLLDLVDPASGEPNAESPTAAIQLSQLDLNDGNRVSCGSTGDDYNDSSFNVGLTLDEGSGSYPNESQKSKNMSFTSEELVADDSFLDSESASMEPIWSTNDKDTLSLFLADNVHSGFGVSGKSEANNDSAVTTCDAVGRGTFSADGNAHSAAMGKPTSHSFQTLSGDSAISEEYRRFDGAKVGIDKVLDDGFEFIDAMDQSLLGPFENQSNGATWLSLYS